MLERPDPVVVVGGGVAGMVFARALARADVPVTLLERSDRLGGQLATHEVGGIALDAGAEAFAVRGGVVQAYLEQLGIGDEIVDPAPLGSWLQPVDGPALPLPASALLGIPGSPLATDTVAVLGGRAAARAYLDVLLPAQVGAKAATLGALVRARMGDAVVERLVAPVTMGVHSLHPDELPVERAHPKLRDAILKQGCLSRAVRALRASSPAGSQVRGLRGGVATLVPALAAELERYGVDVRLGAEAVSFEEDGVRVRPWSRHADLRSPTRPPAGDADLGSAAPEESDEEFEGLELVPGRVVVAAPIGATGGSTAHLVTLVVDAPALDAAPRGTGILVASGGPVGAKALTHVTAKWPWLAERTPSGRHVLRLSYASVATVEQARVDAERLLGVDLPASGVVDSAVREWRRAADAPPLDGVLRIGEAADGTGLATVIARSGEHAERWLEPPRAADTV